MKSATAALLIWVDPVGPGDVSPIEAGYLVRRFAEEFRFANDRLDPPVNNAGLLL